MCVLHVHSKKTSFSAFLKKTRLPAYRKHEKGDVTAIGRRIPYDDYGFSCEVSNREWTDLAGQIEDAYVFLRKHRLALRSLMKTHRVSDFRLDFT